MVRGISRRWSDAGCPVQSAWDCFSWQAEAGVAGEPVAPFYVPGCSRTTVGATPETRGLALLIFVHSVYVFSSLVLKWRLRDLQSDESAKLGMSATILTWAAYYVNRPQAWNLWTFPFLYLFLVPDLVEPRLFRRLRRRGIVPAIFDFRLASLTFLLVAMLLSMNYFILLATLLPTDKSEINMSMVSGILMPEGSANALQAQAGFLGVRRHPAHCSSAATLTHSLYSLAASTPCQSTTRSRKPLPLLSSTGSSQRYTEFLHP